MPVPVQITFRDFDSSDAVKARVEDEVAKLERYYPRIVSVRVVLEQPHKHKVKGNTFRTVVSIALPGEDIEVSRHPGQNAAHEDIYVSIRDAFDEARRRLSQHKERQRGDVKHHEGPPHGRIASMFPDHGFIRSEDGRDLYFHRNAVLNDDFDKLEVGAEVRFAETMGEQGPQASTVTPVGKQNHAPMAAPDTSIATSRG
jgi:ribosomal subunit interface protein